MVGSGWAERTFYIDVIGSVEEGAAVIGWRSRSGRSSCRGWELQRRFACVTNAPRGHLRHTADAVKGNVVITLIVDRNWSVFT